MEALSYRERQVGEKQEENNRLKLRPLNALQRGVSALTNALATEQQDKAEAGKIEKTDGEDGS